MSTPVMKAALSLRSFFIFNSSFGPKEGEEEKKILFYHPQETDIDSKVKDVGLCEAIIKFSSTFTTDESVQALHTQKTCQLYHQPEPGFWMVMILNVPFERKSRDSGDYNEYHGDDIHDIVYRAVLKHSYRLFHLFNGTFESNLAGEDLSAVANLIGHLEEFYGKYILQLKLKDCDVLDALGSVQYLPLNQLLFLRVQNFINMIEATFEPIKQCIFLYDEHIIWSGINPTDLYTIYEYLNGSMFSNSPGQERSRKIHIKIAGQDKAFNFMVCRKVQHITLCLFLEPVENEQALYHELNAVINPQLTSISSDITQHLSQQSCLENGSSKDDCSSTPKFIFFNELNLHHRGTVRLGIQKKYQSGGSIPHDVMNLIVDLLNDSRKNNCNIVEETILKTHEDFWVVKRSCNSRHVFIVLNKSSTLIDVSEETKRILDQNMKGVFF
ncbi:vacuolar fusion protein CCZ1 homolog [Topomyia yanbarensis]|uniref:vacuolar fusion protein CCZ1 homolog n=1 Tax=Topomyia yanbarensis TaxID=2498891 RepID=UPI00273BBD03|nr:vacuolar fusion protein CCZ1 homolog [Topomyia yanbarensis]XP_058833550.1 vacuolar fusion protein CCZ1 homolog [Topomyia yanbarensis]